jgi:hypothetical protein
MRTMSAEYEWEALPTVQGEFEDEFEMEGEFESEEFFRRIAGLAQRAARSPALRRVGLTAARSALRGLGPIGGIAAGALPQREGEWEDEGELSPIRRVYPDALMEHLGHAAAAAENEAEAEAFIGALVPLAARLIPRAASAITRAAPGLIRGLAGVTRTLRRNPATRPLVRAVPTIMRRTAASVAQQAARGRPVTPTTAVRTLARQTARVLSSPQKCTQAWKRSRSLDRRFHQAARR